MCQAIPGLPDGAPTRDDGGRWPDDAGPASDADPCEGVPNRLAEFDARNYPIPDDDPQGIDLPLSLDSGGCVTVQSVEVWVQILHTYRGDVELRLTSPAGDTELLLASSEDSADDIFASFDVDLAAGDSADGDWVLNVSDVVADLVGTVDYWSIGINRSAP